MYDDDWSRELGPPVDDDRAQIWRYVSLPAFLQILQTRTLFFPSIATLANSDPWEGRWSRKEAPKVSAALHDAITKLKEMRPRVIGVGRLDAMEIKRSVEEGIGTSVYVNCWHLNNEESAAMWSIYGANHGIALQSSVGLLKSAFAVEERPVAIARVQYGLSVELTDAPIRLAFRKRDSFSYEQELRAVVTTAPLNFAGTAVKIDLETLIEKMYLWPLAPSWMLELIWAEVRLHGLDKPIQKSDLHDPA